MANQEPRAVVLFGPPGSGKGTLGRALGALPGFEHYDMGGALRAVNRESAPGRSIRDHLDSGELLPDRLVHEVFFADLERLALEGRYRPERDVLLLDGIPRTPVQYRTLAERLDLVGVVSLEVPDRKDLAERLHRRARDEQRLDDLQPEVIARRMRAFERERGPLWELFPSREVHAVDAGREPLVVLEGASRALAALLERAQSPRRAGRFSWARLAPHALACLLYTALGGIVASGCRVTDMRRELANCQVAARDQLDTIERQQRQNLRLNRQLRTVYAWMGLIREGETGYPARIERLRSRAAEAADGSEAARGGDSPRPELSGAGG